MFYISENFDYIINIITEYILHNVQKDVITEHFDEYEYIRCRLYNISIESSLIHDELNLSYLLNEFNIKANTNVEVNIYAVTYSEGIKSFKGLVKKIANTINSDILVFDECSKLIYKRNNYEYFIDNSFWKSN